MLTLASLKGDAVLTDGTSTPAAEFVQSPPRPLWVYGATRFCLDLHRLTGVWLEDVREAELLGRVLHPEQHPRLGRGFERLTRDAIIAEQQAADPGAWARVRVEQQVDALWRPVTRDGIRIDETALRRMSEDIERERRACIAEHGVDLTTLDHATEQWLARHAIHVPGGLSHENWNGAVMLPSSRPAWEAFTQARTIAQDAGKVRELLDACRDGRVHPTIPAMAAVTGRQQISGPALQNLASRMRPVVMADEGSVLVGCDMHAVEPHVAAWLSGDRMLGAHLEQGDPYIALAGNIWPGETVTPEHRRLAKTALLAVLYGQGAASTATRLGVTPAEGERIRSALWGTYPRLRDWCEDMRRATSLRTGFSRPLPLPVSSHAAVNYTIQGTAADLLKDITLDVHAAGLRLLLPVHDELLVQARPEDAEQVRVQLEALMTRTLPDGLMVRGEGAVCGARWAKC